MPYPFENIRASSLQADAFKKKLPNVTTAMPEFFRVMATAYKSIEQKDMYGMPQGIRRDLGIETSLKLLLIACFNDKVITANEPALAVSDKLRKLSLKWYSMGNELSSCLYFGYYFYSMQSTALFTVKELLQQISFLVDGAGLSQNPDVLDLLAPTHSNSWYRSKNGVGDKLYDIHIQDADLTRTDLPRPGVQLHFKKTQVFDLRAPFFIDTSLIETPQIHQQKVIASCPKCQQKCRGPLFEHLEIKCPSCQQVWKQRT
jgi:hypothetical protein